MTYADSSFFFSYYASDTNSPRADAWRLAHPSPLPFSSLNRLELRNALELAVFQKRISPQESSEAWQTVESDLRDGLLIPTPLLFVDVFREAELLAANHTAQVGTRSLDLLHVAAARLLGVEELVTFDQRQVTLVTRLNLPLALL
ncbi:MAG: type II toxin-antitoxin system VapC family toxin [Verrucomicrobia bacterium]|nr:type II toxin-antitoxin system VapC family toxin [Verrucomicrobiota bacterium]